MRADAQARLGVGHLSEERCPGKESRLPAPEVTTKCCCLALFEKDVTATH